MCGMCLTLSGAGNFDKIWTDQPAVDSPCGTPTVASLGKFEGFSYVEPGFLASRVGPEVVGQIGAVAAAKQTAKKSEAESAEQAAAVASS